MTLDQIFPTQASDLNKDIFDCVVIGGGFYGVNLALELKRVHNFERVLIVEQEDTLLGRASSVNQARIHEGYHYPRSFTTAFRSRINSPLFRSEWKNAVVDNVETFYGIARFDSKVNSKQFVRFCKSIDANITLARPEIRRQFSDRLIEDVFSVDEKVFDARKLSKWAFESLHSSRIETRLAVRALRVELLSDESLQVTLENEDLSRTMVGARYVFNATYSGINGVAHNFDTPPSAIKHEITEMPLVVVPEEFENRGITVMDGPFFSILPYPTRPGAHTMSHVRYTPHYSWIDSKDKSPYEELRSYRGQSRFDRMQRDIARYFPAANYFQKIDSLMEVKSVLMMNDTDDGRPILWEKPEQFANYFNVLGGKIDNVFDVLDRLGIELKNSGDSE